MSTISHADWLAQAEDKFGPDPRLWAFVCPNCGDVANGQDFRAALDAAGRPDELASTYVGQGCIGRVAGALNRQTGYATGKYTGRGCDWAAFGLFGGPVTITTEDGKQMHAFDFAEVGVK